MRSLTLENFQLPPLFKIWPYPKFQKEITRLILLPDKQAREKPFPIQSPSQIFQKIKKGICPIDLEWSYWFLTKNQFLKYALSQEVRFFINLIQGFYKYFQMNLVGLQGYQTISRQAKLLDEGVDIVVTTLDRLDKMIEKKRLFLSQVQYLVIDEADTFLDSGFSNQLSNFIQIIQHKQENHSIPCQVISVGATYTGPLKQFFNKNFKNDIKLLIQQKTHLNLQNLSHEFISVGQLDKLDPLLALLQEELPSMNSNQGSMMIFVNSIACSQALEYKLKESDCVQLHGDLPKKVREQNLRRFRDREMKILISSDLGSRGLDFTFLSHVINFDFPRTNSDYLHRAGRAGRAGSKGKVITLHHQKDIPAIKQLQQAYDNEQPIAIKGSSYSQINKEILQRQKSLQQQGEQYEIQEFQEQKNLHKQSQMIQIKQPMEKKKVQQNRIKGYIPPKNKFEQQLKSYRKIIKNTKRHQRLAQQNRFKSIKHKMRKIKRTEQRENQKKKQPY